MLILSIRGCDQVAQLARQSPRRSRPHEDWTCVVMTRTEAVQPANVFCGYAILVAASLASLIVLGLSSSRVLKVSARGS
jgi:hypothetical protein